MSYRVPTSSGLSGSDLNFYNKLGLPLRQKTSPAVCNLDAGLNERDGGTGPMVWTFHFEPAPVGS